ncbi:uncharacterized protein LOC108034211 isoform X3 [Drosophila biarmipes]|uniref:uncharacterized protein LOC108034211 isoform X3 n=1 Tax=Drosophila biarmipes TaxID=125945 RepID=UPI0007E82DD4|nr:uncharacterized protein LOC108034211 isoform X3 [Drosophila biarmipes]
MGKHRTLQQDAIFLKFMQSHKDFARGSSRGNRLETNEAWASLSQALNACGPPCLEGLEVHHQEEVHR